MVLDLFWPTLSYRRELGGGGGAGKEMDGIVFKAMQGAFYIHYFIQPF